MAPTRTTRKSSRRSSPLTRNHAKGSSTPATPAAEPDEENASSFDAKGKWIEPPLRPPAPSFEDYKGLERHGVLEHMAPLGTFPSAKLKAKFKGDPTRRGGWAASRALRDLATTPESTPALSSRRSGSRRAETRSQVTPAPAEPVRETVSPSKASTRSSARARSVQSSPQITTPQTAPPASTTASIDKPRLQQIVDFAAAKSEAAGHLHLASALTKLYEQSVGNQYLTGMLHAVLKGTPSEQHKADFKHHIRMNRSRPESVQTPSRTPKSASKSKQTPEQSAVSGAAVNGIRSDHSTRTRSSANKPEANEEKSSPTPNMPTTDDPPAQADVSERPTKRQKPMGRSQSTSSSSSLSSAQSLEEISTAAGALIDGVPTDANVNANDPGTAEALAGEQPITGPATRQGSRGPKQPTASSTTSTLGKRSSDVAGFNGDEDDKRAEVEADKVLLLNKRRMTRNFSDIEFDQSRVRGSPTPPPPGPSNSAIPFTDSALTVRAPNTHPRLRNGANKASGASDEVEDLYSSTPSTSGGIPLSGAALKRFSSRPGTPVLSGRVGKKAKKTARVKMSPLKKKAGVIAGVARAGRQDSPVGYGEKENPQHRQREFFVATAVSQDDNNDFCSACGGNGDLLCCDGCDRSFHFTCVDPPMDKDELPESWFCFACQARRDPPPKMPRGLFAGMQSKIFFKNPACYALPSNIREHYEGVKTGDEGEYEEAMTSKPKTRGGYDEVPDLLKLKDAKGKTVLCYKCGKSALGHQQIIACDYCNLQWHLDCLDPPMSNPPPRGGHGKPRHPWMCPNHVEHDLRAIAEAQSDGWNGNRSHKIRRAKHAPVVDTALRRGFENNGMIEIENDTSDEEEDPFYDHQMYGTVYRIAEKGIKLDFIDKVKTMREAEAAALQAANERAVTHLPQPKSALQAARERAVTSLPEPTGQGTSRGTSEPPAPQTSTLEKRSLIDQKAALNLAQFAQANSDLNLSSDAVDNLINMLIAEAPSDVISLVSETIAKESAVPPSPPSSDSRPDQPELAVSQKERNTLLLLQQLITRRLNGGNAATT
ncbi:MAG: hypothetical protein M4579_006082 [Chaenotheca gracillima]|nr:MAG: hypothetical protein M4579_006082 [Chaenotheca gracillima]